MFAEFKLISGVVHIPEIGFVKTYGISAKEGDERKQIPDISDDKQKIEELVELLNNSQVCIVHFESIINDWLQS